MPRLRAGRAFAALGLAALAAGLLALLPRHASQAEGPMPPAAHEPRDVGFRVMAGAGLLMLLGLGAMMGLALWLYPKSTDDQTVQRPLPRFPDPQLQPSPPQDMAAFHARQLRQLNGLYWIDHAAGRVHIPVDQAMRDVAKTGVPDWPTR